MKKTIIPALLILALFAGCSGKNNHPLPRHMYKNTMAQTTIMPAAADNSANMMVSLPATIEGNNGNAVVVSVYFIGSPNQMVTVLGVGGVSPFKSTQLNVWNSVKILPTPSIQNLTITAADSPNNYNLVSTTPGRPGIRNPYGANASRYSNGMGDTAIVIVQDTAVTTW